jgi:predicted phage tail protein
MRTATNDVLRALTAAAVLLSGVVHLDQWAAGFRDAAVIGPLFLMNFCGGIVLGVIVLAWRHWLPVLAAAGYGAVTLAFFYLAVVRGLFGVHEILGGWAEVLAQVAEYSAIVFGLGAAATASRARLPRRAASRPGPAAPTLSSHARR